jgi:hypothetical protein
MASSSTDNTMARPAADPSTATTLEQMPIGLQTRHSVHVVQILFGPALYDHYLGENASVLGYGGGRFPTSPQVHDAVFKARRSDVPGDIPSLHHYKHFMAFMGQLHPGLFYAHHVKRGHYPAYSLNAKRNFLACGHLPHPAGKTEIRLSAPAAFFAPISILSSE